jgi:hypothetical protein
VRRGTASRRSAATSQVAVALATVATAIGLAACGSSDSEPKTIEEIRVCIEETGLVVTKSPVEGSVNVPLPDGTAIPVEVDESEDEAQANAEDWLAFGESAGKAGDFVVEGSTWVGYPGEVPEDIRGKIQGCAF